MKKLLLGFLSLLLIAAAPVPTGFVNDLAQIIPDDREVQIERTLRDYEARTSIEIAVVTTPSLEGNEIEEYAHTLFNEWGVGKQGANNGVLVVIAPNEHKYRVEVGRGLEGDLTDADTSVMAHDSLVEAFRAGDYAGGIENLTQALVSHLGDMTPDQRATFHRKMEEAAKRKAEEAQAKFFDFVGSVFVLLMGMGALVLVFLGVRSVQKKLRTRKLNMERRKALHIQLTKIQSELTRLMNERSAIDLPNLPAWMQDDKEDHGGSFGEALELAVAAHKEFGGLIETDIDEAEKLRSTIDRHLEDAERSLELLRTIPEQVRAYRDKTEQLVTETCTAIDALLKRASLLSQKHYRISDIVPALDIRRLEQEKKSIQEQLASRGEGPQDASEVVHDKAKRLLAKVQSLQGALEGSIAEQSASTRRIATLEKRVQEFPALLAEHRARLARLRQLAPAKHWTSLEAQLPVFERTLGGIAPRLEVAIRANSMESQLFKDATVTLATAETALGVIDTAVQAAATLESAVVRAEREYSARLQSTQSALSTAARLMSNSDVGSGAKNRLAEAQRILDSAQPSGSPPDWIGVVDLLQQAAAKAGQAAQLARSDIESAERERRRRKDEEERRERLAREASYSSLNSSSDYSSGGGSSFSFGGGDSGGGGTSGSW